MYACIYIHVFYDCFVPKQLERQTLLSLICCFYVGGTEKRLHCLSWYLTNPAMLFIIKTYVLIYIRMNQNMTRDFISMMHTCSLLNMDLCVRFCIRLCLYHTCINVDSR